MVIKENKSILKKIFKNHVKNFIKTPVCSKQNELNFKYFSDPIVFKKNKTSSLKIACLISEPLFLCLNYDANCLNIPLDNWEMFLEENNPDFILIESSWKVSAQGWNLQINSIGPNSLLSKLIYQCRRKNYPIVFWYTIDPIHIPLFVKTAQLCDKVYAADKKSQQQLENKLSGIPVGHLAIAVQPAIHNPYIIDTWTKKKKITPNFSFLFDGWADVIEFTEILTPQLLPLCKTGLHIVDSKFKYNTNVFNYTPELNIHIMGSMSYLEFISALKSYPILLQPDPTLSSSIARARASLEAICCGASVLTNDISYIVLNEIKLPRMALFETNKRAFSSDALKLLEDKNERSKAVHVARREIMKSHTYMHRLETICCDLHISTNWNKFPLASVILASKRPNYIEKFIETYEKQTYPNKELIITLNKNDIIAAEKINNYIKDKNNVKLLILHQENNIGTCLNTAIKEANGELWFKMDDDDFYGEHYLTDMVLAWQSTEIDVFGKPLSYVYFEEENATYQMSGSRFRNIINCQRYPCGATIAGTKKVSNVVLFEMGVRASVDIDFIKKCIKKGYTILLIDDYNFAIFRSSKSNFHTWRKNDINLKKVAKKISQGFSKENIYI